MMIDELAFKSATTLATVIDFKSYLGSHMAVKLSNTTAVSLDELPLPEAELSDELDGMVALTTGAANFICRAL
jgi:hypothetical protein